VMAVSEYLAAHPGVLSGSRLKIVVKPSYSKEQIQSIVIGFLEQKLNGQAYLALNQDESGSIPLVTEDDVSEMLKNLEIFS